MTQLSEIKQKFSETFPSGWNKELKDEATIKLWLQKILFFEKHFLLFFAHSLLEGEYACSPNELNKEIADLLNIFDDDFPASSSSKRIQNLAAKYNSMNAYHSGVIKDYRRFIEFSERRCDQRYRIIRFSAYREEIQNIGKSQYATIYGVLLDLAKHDFYYGNNVREIGEVLILKEAIEEIQKKTSDKEVSLLCEVIQTKCNFLLKKNLSDESGEFDYAIDFAYKHIDSKDLSIPNYDSVYANYENYIRESYPFETNFWKSLQQKIQRERNKNLSDMVLLMKYYKDSHDTSVIQVTNLLDHFNKAYTDAENKARTRNLRYEQYALYTLKNYMYNCRFSYILREVKGYDIKQLEEDLEHLKNIQQETGIYNFYPYKKAVVFLLEKISQNRDNLEYIKHAMKLLKSNMREYQGAFSWCNNISFYPIQGIYNDCLIDYPDWGKVYNPSSFCRAINYHLAKREMDEYASRVRVAENEIPMAEERAEIMAIKDQISKEQDKNIQTLTIFVSIITFLFGCVSFFAETKSDIGGYKTLLINVVTLGFILLLFVSMMFVWRIFNTSSYKNKSHWRWQLACIVAIIIIFVLAILKVLF